MAKVKLRDFLEMLLEVVHSKLPEYQQDTTHMTLVALGKLLRGWPTPLAHTLQAPFWKAFIEVAQTQLQNLGSVFVASAIRALHSLDQKDCPVEQKDSARLILSMCPEDRRVSEPRHIIAALQALIDVKQTQPVIWEAVWKLCEMAAGSEHEWKSHDITDMVKVLFKIGLEKKKEKM